MYIYKRQVTASEVDRYLKLKIFPLINYIQDCEGFHINSVTPLINYLNQKNGGIFLIFRQVTINQLPSQYDNIILKTYPYLTKPYFGFRNTIMYNEKNEVMLTSYAIGSFTSIKTLDPIKLPNDVITSLDPEEKFDMVYLDRKIIYNNDNPLYHNSFIVTKSMIDPYNHLNNAFYVSMCYDVLPDNFIFNTFRIEYKRSFLINELIYPVSYKQNDKTIVIVLYDKDNNINSVIEFTSL